MLKTGVVGGSFFVKHLWTEHFAPLNELNEIAGFLHLQALNEKMYVFWNCDVKTWLFLGFVVNTEYGPVLLHIVFPILQYCLGTRVFLFSLDFLFCMHGDIGFFFPTTISFIYSFSFKIIVTLWLLTLFTNFSWLSFFIYG